MDGIGWEWDMGRERGREEEQKKIEIKKTVKSGNNGGKKQKNAHRNVYTFGVESKSVGQAVGLEQGSVFFENLTWLTSDEAAEYLRLPSVGALRALVCRRKVPFHKLGRSLRFKKNELDRLLECSRKGGF